MKKLLLAAIIALVLMSGCSGPGPDIDTDKGPTTGSQVGPGGCTSKEECDAFCAENPEVCQEFCEQHPETCESGDAGPPKQDEINPEEELRNELPITFTYVMPMYMNNVKYDRYVVYYLEKYKKCSGRDAITGVINSYGGDETPEKSHWAKFTLYLDNGEYGSSDGIGQSELAFDDAVSKKADYALITQLNGMFSVAGENFNDSEVWDSDTPTIIKDIYYAGSNIGDILGNISLKKKSEINSYAVPCTEFSVNIKSDTGFNGEMIYCVADKDSEINLPYTVSITVPQMENSNDVELKKVEKKSSGVAFYPQCMEPVYCGMPELMTKEERNNCNSQGNVIFEERGADHCITQNLCLNQEELARKALMQNQPPSCAEPSDELVQEAMKCIETEQEPISSEMDDKGCYVSLDCPE